MIYSYAAEEGRWGEARQQLDDALEQAVPPSRETWGRLPLHQRQMRNAQSIAGRS